MTRAAAIATRVSTDHQLDGTSLQSQHDDCMARAQADGFEVTLTVEDAGISGTNLTREGLNRVLEAGRRGAIQRLYCWDFDRLSRATVRETLNLLDDFNRAGVTIHDRYGKEAT